MKKIFKIAIVVLFTIIILSLISKCYATDTIDPENYKIDIENINAGELSDVAKNIVTAITTIGIIISIIAIMVIGIKYMIGSAEEKAEYKKTMIPYILGVLLLFGGSIIIIAIYNVAKSI